MYPPTTFVLSLPHTKKSHLDRGQFKTVCLCVAHNVLQAHPQEFLEFQLSNGYSPANLANLSTRQKFTIFGEFEYSPKWSF